MPHFSLTITGLPVNEAKNGLGLTTDDFDAYHARGLTVLLVTATHLASSFDTDNHKQNLP